MLWNLITHIGSLYFCLAVIAVLFTIGKRRLAVGLSFLLLITALLITSLKLLFKTPRPPLHLEPTYSFPSGHTAIAGALAGFFLNKKTLLLLALPVLVGISRVILNEHYPIDVLAGLALGLASAYFFRAFFDAKYLEYEKIEEKYRTEGIMLMALFFTVTFFLSIYPSYYTSYSGIFAGLFIGVLLNDKKNEKISLKRGIIALSGFTILLVPISNPQLLYLTHFFIGIWTSFLAPLIAGFFDPAKQ